VISGKISRRSRSRSLRWPRVTESRRLAAFGDRSGQGDPHDAAKRGLDRVIDADDRSDNRGDPGEEARGAGAGAGTRAGDGLVDRFSEKLKLFCFVSPMRVGILGLISAFRKWPAAPSEQYKPRDQERVVPAGLPLRDLPRHRIAGCERGDPLPLNNNSLVQSILRNA